MSNINNDLNKKALKAGSFYVICQFLVRGLSFLATPLYTRLLTTEQYGVVKIYESWLLILVPVVTLGLYRSVEVAKYDYREKYQSYTSSIIKLGALLCAGFAVICIVFGKWVCGILEFTPWMLAVMLLYLFAEFAIMCYQRREKQLMRYRNSVRFTMITVPLATVLSIALLFYGRNAGQDNMMLFYRIAGYYTPVIAGGFILAVIMLFQGRSENLKLDWRYGVVYSVPLIAELLSIQIMNQLDKIMIQKMVGESEAGVYSLATTVSFIIWVIEDAVWGAWQPWLYEKIGMNEEKDVKLPCTKMMNIFGMLSVVITVMAPELILILGGVKYQYAIYIVSPLVTSTLFRFYGYSYSAIQNYEKKTGYVAVGTVIAMIVNTAANYIGIKFFGYVAAAYATALSYFILLVIQGIFEKKVTGRVVMPLKKTLLIAVGYFAVCEIFILLYSANIFIRYAIAAGLIIAYAFKNRGMLRIIIREYIK